MATTTTEETVRREQDDHADTQRKRHEGDPDFDPTTDPAGKALFDKTAYDSPALALPMVDGEGIDKIRVKVEGSVMLDRSNEDHIALFRRIQLGKPVELRVAGRGSRVSTGFTTNKDGDLDAVVAERAVKVDTVYILTSEEL